jgi:hypothetical protein
MSSDVLGRRIIRLMMDGYLPRISRPRVLAGPGEGIQCDACGKCIRTREVQYDIEYETARQGPRRTLRLHLACHDLWQAAVRKVNGRPSSQPQPGRLST